MAFCVELSHGCRFCPVSFLHLHLVISRRFYPKWLTNEDNGSNQIKSNHLSYCWIMNTDLNWGKWGLKFFRCCSGIFSDLLDELSLHSWSNFGRPATPGKVHHCSRFSPFVDNCSDRGSLESQSLRNGFITLSRLIHVNYFVLICSWISLDCGMMCGSFKHASLCQTDSIKWFLDHQVGSNQAWVWLVKFNIVRFNNVVNHSSFMI